MIRRAEEKDIKDILSLLSQVLEVHHKIRPDLFKGNSTKYTERELSALISLDDRPIFVYEDEEGKVRGYGFCVIQTHPADNILTDIRTIYIDDICVDEKARGRGVGKAIFNYIKEYAKDTGCHNITLNVWEGNDGAKAFYDSLGFTPYKYGMEVLL
ncbi:MAG: GNAT family N-acetyltransferase [Clostridiales bacterium]|nr:GNAT family N-acetyltransferase [Clostridiales bacterium]MBR6484640.1 GNAT family N-acetyltransferase [Clostridiales bacterium]